MRFGFPDVVVSLTFTFTFTFTFPFPFPAAGAALAQAQAPPFLGRMESITGAELNARIYRALLDRGRRKATSRAAVAHDVSPPLSALLTQAQAPPVLENEAIVRDPGALAGTRASANAPESDGEQEPTDEPIPPYVAPPVPEEAAAIEQRTMGTKDGAVLVESFDGLGIGFEGPQGTSTGKNPSDNSLAVGPDHIVQIVNTRLAIFTKKRARFDTTGRVLYGAVPTRTLFHGFGGRCEERNYGDAVVRYDQLADRWLFVMPIFSRGRSRPDQPVPGRSGEPARRSVPGRPDQPGAGEPLFVPPPEPAEPAPLHLEERERAPEPEGVYSMCYAVSTSSDPLGTYYRYEFLRPLFPDYPRPAVWPDGYYVPTSTGDDVVEKHACVVDRNRMLRGEPATEQCVILAGVNFLNNADLDGRALPPPGAPNIMLATGGTQLNQVMEDDGIYYWKFHVDWDDPSKTRLDGPVKIPVAPYHYLCDGQLTQCVPQPDTDRRLDAQGDKIMARVVYRRIGDRESVVAVHSVNTSTGGGGLRWYELRLDAHRDLVLFQQGTFAPDGSYRWMASPAMDKDGRIGIGYSFGGGPHFAGQRFAARDAGDPPGQLTRRETILVDGEAAQTETFRWEDYTQTAVDPSDDCTIWYVGDYLKENEGRYSTKIGAFRMGDCGIR
jgi:hypothetical protein